MIVKSDFNEYLERGKNALILDYPKCQETTSALFSMVYDFLSADFEELTDSRVYRFFLSSFKEMICFAFEKGLSKAYLRGFFKILNNPAVVEFIAGHAPSKAADIRNVMHRFLHFFIGSWQGHNHDRDKVLEEIIGLIDYWM